MTDLERRALGALENARNGLKWYRDAHPKDDSTADDEIEIELEGLIQELQDKDLQSEHCTNYHCPGDCGMKGHELAQPVEATYTANQIALAFAAAGESDSACSSVLNELEHG